MNQIRRMIGIQISITSGLCMLILILCGKHAAVASALGCLTGLGGTAVSAWIIWHKPIYQSITLIIKRYLISEITKIFFSIFVMLAFFLLWPGQGLWYLLGLVSVTLAYWLALL